MGETNGRFMSLRSVSISTIMVNEGGWCSGKNIGSGSEKLGFSAQLSGQVTQALVHDCSFVVFSTLALLVVV